MKHIASRAGLNVPENPKKSMADPGMTASWIGIWGNVVLTLFKAIGGILGHSTAMISDAAHSASDLVATATVLLSLRIARKPSDATHPYGHGKVESIAAAAVGVILTGVGLAIIWSAVKSVVAILSGDLGEAPRVIALVAAFVSIVTKEAMFRYTYRVGKRINSPAVVASAWDHRSDAYSSIGTLAGIGGALLGDAVGYPVLHILDPIAGAIVAVFIIKIAVDVMRDAINGLMDASVSPEILGRIRDVAIGVDGVQDVHDLKARQIGSEIRVDMDLEVKPDATVVEGHNLVEDVRSAIWRNIEHVGTVKVHVDPSGGGELAPARREIEERALKIARDLPGVLGIHDIRLHYVGSGLAVDVDIEVDPTIDVLQGHRIAKTVEEILKEIDGVRDVMVHIDPLGRYEPRDNLRFRGEVEKRIVEVSKGIPGVLGVHDVKTHYVESGLAVDLDVIVDSSISAIQGHDIAQSVENTILGIGGIDEVMVHIDPVGRYGMEGHVPVRDVEERVREIARSVPGVLDLRDVRAHFIGSKMEVDIDIEVDPAINIVRGHDIASAVKDAILAIGSVDEVMVHVEPLGEGR
ncbi:MAG: cation-efflux pump [bacterium]